MEIDVPMERRVYKPMIKKEFQMYLRVSPKTLQRKLKPFKAELEALGCTGNQLPSDAVKMLAYEFHIEDCIPFKIVPNTPSENIEDGTLLTINAPNTVVKNEQEYNELKSMTPDMVNQLYNVFKRCTLAEVLLPVYRLMDLPSLDEEVPYIDEDYVDAAQLIDVDGKQGILVTEDNKVFLSRVPKRICTYILTDDIVL